MQLGNLKIQRIIPKEWLPKALSTEQQAINKATKSKRVSAILTKRKSYVAEMKQDELKIAIELAEDVCRPRRELLYEMYRRAMNDGHFTGEYEKAINKVVGSPFGIFKVGSTEIDEEATRLLQKDWFEEYRTYFEESIFWGHSLVQFLDMVPSSNGILEFSKIDLIEREHVRPEEGYIVLDVGDDKGIPFRDPTIAKAFRLIEMGKPKSLGKLQIITKEYIWKNYSRGDWSRHSEKFGQPFIQIKTDTSDVTEVNKLENMASNFGNNMWAIVDVNDEIDVKEASFKDSFQIYKEKVLMCNDEMSKASTWQTGTSDEKAFVGAAEVHQDVLDDYTEWRKRKQTYHVNDTLIPFLIEHGYPLKDREFRYLTYKESNPEEDNKEQNKQQGAGGQTPAKKSNAQQRALFKFSQKVFAQR